MKILGIILGLLFWIIAYLAGIQKMVGIIPTVHTEQISDPDRLGKIIGLWLFFLGIFVGALPYGLKNIPAKIGVYLIVFVPLIILMRIYWAIRTFEQQDKL